MRSTHRLLLDWAEQGRIESGDLPRAARLLGVTPSALDWQRFLYRVCLGLGALLLVAGVVFFFAYNWKDVGRYSQFAIAEGLVVACIAGVWFLGLEQVAGKLALTAAAVLFGALLALIGQTYQTGADTYELFAAWAVLILPWTLVARFQPLWLLWFAVTNIAVPLYFRAFPGILAVFLDVDTALWAALAFNGGALLVWESRASGGADWMHARWVARSLAIAAGIAATMLGLMDVFDRGLPGWRLVGWLVWAAGIYAAYRLWRLDLFVLAGLVLSVGVVVTGFLANSLLDGRDLVDSLVDGLLLIGLVIIGLTAAGAAWLRGVAAQGDSR